MLTLVGGSSKETLIYLSYGGENRDWREYSIFKKTS